MEARIESERKRWKDAYAIINKLTLNKTRPVVEGSSEYHKCAAAAVIIREVEAGADGLKAEKAKLEARIKELEE